MERRKNANKSGATILSDGMGKDDQTKATKAGRAVRHPSKESDAGLLNLSMSVTMGKVAGSISYTIMDGEGR
jgi:hypothetical protein